MIRGLSVAAAFLVGAVALAGFAVAIGGSIWRRGTALAVADLMRVSDTAGTLDPAAPASGADELPAPVRRYFEFALPGGPAPIRTATIRWAGEFRTDPAGRWAPFTAEQRFTIDPPGFVWDADIRMLPLLSVRVRDGYAHAGATMHARIGGVLTVVDAGGTPEIAQSSLARWLGEAVWFPAALLPRDAPGSSLRWEAIDDSTARAVVIDGPVTASADFHFGPGGEITRMRALRFRDIGGRPVATPLQGQYRQYYSRGGTMVPGEAEVAWLLPEGPFEYWRGQPVEIEYEPSIRDR